MKMQSQEQLKCERDGWMEIARQYSNNEDYYHEQRDKLVEVIRSAAYNLGVPNDEYPANVAEVYRTLSDAFLKYHVPNVDV